MNILIIDAQNDFHEGGNLGVKGAKADSKRIGTFLKKNKNDINTIFISLDTHTKNHIGFPGFWEIIDNDQSRIDEYTTFYVDHDIILGKYQNKIRQFEPKNKKLLKWTKEYIKELPSYGKGNALIWPYHCIEKTYGHKLYEPLKTIIDAYDKNNVEYHIKGQNEATEMYSIFKAEIPTVNVTKLNKDKYYSKININISNSSLIENPEKLKEVYLNTQFNNKLYKSLTKDGLPILICGQALSHCVNWSLRDLVNKLIEDKNKFYVKSKILLNDKVILLVNASSAIKGFEKNVKELFQFCKKKNVALKYLYKGLIVDKL